VSDRRDDRSRERIGDRASEQGYESAPALSDEIDPRDLAPDVRAELHALSRSTADSVARHLVAAGQLLDDEPEVALAHARAARRLAPRIAAVREALGLASYHNGEWQAAIAELRTYHRLTGRQTHLAVIADSERALGRPERAVDIYRTADRSTLAPDEAIELLIVAAAARGDMGQRDAAVAMLQVKELTADSREPWVVRLRYAYAESLLAAGRREEAREWFARAAEIDDNVTTDAAERLLELDGVALDDVEFDDDLEDEADNEFDVIAEEDTPTEADEDRIDDRADDIEDEIDEIDRQIDDEVEVEQDVEDEVEQDVEDEVQQDVGVEDDGVEDDVEVEQDGSHPEDLR
jgi:tetratricopeptide (TPR) repeat protein